MRTLSLANGFLSSVSDLVAQGIEGSVSVRAASGERSETLPSEAAGKPGPTRRPAAACTAEGSKE